MFCVSQTVGFQFEASAFRADLEAVCNEAVSSAQNAPTMQKRSDDAWYTTASSGVRSTYETEYYSDFADYLTADVAAYTAYVASMDSAQHEFAEEQCRLLGLLQDSIDTGLNAVADGTTSLDVQVCFAAGTPIRLSSGEVIPVEEAKPGMKVRVPNENDPEGEHFECKIVEVYHNPPAPVMRLEIESDSTGTRATIRGTENHRFYVVGFGWKAIRDLEIGDMIADALSLFLAG